MVLGIAFWAPRYRVEAILLPVPEGADLWYGDHLVNLLSTDQANSWIGWMAYWWGTIPAELWGFGMSLFGYLIGQWMHAGRPAINDLVRAQARGEVVVESATWDA